MKHKIKLPKHILALPLTASLSIIAGGQMEAATGSDQIIGANTGDYLKGSTVGHGWEVTGAANVALAQGNADSLAYSLQGLATYEGPVWEGLVGADYLYSENNDTVTTDSLRIFGQGQRLLTDRFYLGLAGSYLRDDLADLDYRFDAAAVLGYHVIKNDRTKLSLEFGPGYAWQSQGDIKDDFATIRFAERFEHKISSRSKLWQSAIYTPNIDDFSDYQLTLDAGIDTQISAHWAVRTSARYMYDSTPTGTNDKGDFALLFGLAYSLGGFPDSTAPEGRATLKADKKEEAADALGWTTTAALGVSVAKGNSDSLQVSLAYDTAYRSESDEFFFNAGYSYGENDGLTASDALYASIRYNRLLNQRSYFGVGTSFLRDDLAGVNYRFTPNALLGHYFIKNETMTLALEGGPAYVIEEVNGVSDSYFAVRVAERFTWNASSNVTFNQAAILDLDPKNTDNYLLTVSAYLDVDITENLAWRLSGAWNYDNEPAAGLEKEDLTLTSGIAIKF